MIKNILFDFDGVILDSMKIKGNGFVELFEKYGNENIKLLEQYHYENGGISRFEKIKYFFYSILKKEISDSEVNVLANKFSIIIKKNMYKENNLINETIEFIMNNCKKYNMHIVSGAEHNELNELCEFFDITKYFITINGSPTKKCILVFNILEKYMYKKEETILIGDSINDYESAKNNNIKFYGYNNTRLCEISNRYISDYNEIK